jgi:hypothetical protein
MYVRIHGKVYRLKDNPSAEAYAEQHPLIVFGALFGLLFVAAAIGSAAAQKE